MPKTKKNGKKAITLLLMILSLCTIYILPYLRYTYYTPLQEAMGLVGNNAAYGSLTSVYGIANIILYLPGGWIADKVDAKKLLVFSMISTGLLGFWMATWPGYTVLLIIHVLFAFTTVLTFWSSSIKCVNMIADPDEQGSMFGSLEAGRGIVNLLVVSVFLGIFTAFASDSTRSMTWVVNCCSLLMILVGVALAFLMPKTNAQGATNASIGDSLKAMGHAFKMPVTYILAGLIFTASLCGASASYYAPYLQDGFGMSVTAATVFANYRGVICGVIGAGIAVFLSKKFGRSSKAILGAGAVMLVSFVLMFFIPASIVILWPMLAIMIIATLCNYVYRGLYYAVIDEAGSPKNTVGSIIGIASLIGFLPDSFYGTLCGSWLDTYGLDGFKRIFVSCIVASLLGLVCAFVAERLILKHRAKTKAEATTTAQ